MGFNKTFLPKKGFSEDNNRFVFVRFKNPNVLNQYTFKKNKNEINKEIFKEDQLKRRISPTTHYPLIIRNSDSIFFNLSLFQDCLIQIESKLC